MANAILGRVTTSVARTVLVTAAFIVSPSAAAGQSPCVTGKLDRLLQDNGLPRLSGTASPLSGKVFTAAPSTVPALNEDVQASPMFLWAIPTNRNEYQNVYPPLKDVIGIPAKKADQLKRYETKYVGAFGADRRLAAQKGFDNALQQKQHGVIAIIGHNEGGHFRFLDGDTVGLDELARRCSLNGKLCVFLSCDSNKFVSRGGVGVDEAITATEARWIALELKAFLAKRKAVTPVELAEFVRLQSKKKKAKYRVVFIAETGCEAAKVTAPIALVVCSVDDEHCGLLPSSRQVRENAAAPGR